MKLRAIIHLEQAGGFWAEVPALPGCATQGETLEELRVNLREAMELWFSVGNEVTAANENDIVLELIL